MSSQPSLSKSATATPIPHPLCVRPASLVMSLNFRSPSWRYSVIIGSPPFLKRSTVDPLTVMMSSLPSLSQSIKPTPPLMDSMTYLLSGEEMCETVRPACLLTSSNRGVAGAALGLCAQAVQPNSRVPINFTLRMEIRYVSTGERSVVPAQGHEERGFRLLSRRTTVVNSIRVTAGTDREYDECFRI